jgi:isoquinoline 1-oxidoreductase alpha subunit
MLGAGAQRQAPSRRAARPVKRPSAACHQEKLMRRAIPPGAAQAYGFSDPISFVPVAASHARAPMNRQRSTMRYTLHINGKAHTVDVDSDTPLLWVLRDAVNLKGTKFGCGEGLCGACNVHLDGKVVRSCMTAISDVGNATVTTIEGIGETPVGARLQRAWLDVDVVQCGYCQPGQIMSAAALLAQTKTPSDEDIESAMDGNICRCGTYTRIREAIKQAASADFGSTATKKGA